MTAADTPNGEITRPEVTAEPADQPPVPASGPTCEADVEAPPTGGPTPTGTA